ncbi:hypothetical protein [Flagellimonas myxillae]|uniref:hypothetical protein n=1 Tax=Flagellimonas myxillae TaxID=2942214 RepID=UPI00201EB746|nr:hypothetical protein [Muricauda myxillae]MCL6267648.1 hypothetical protein [Muricauda myxillae]
MKKSKCTKALLTIWMLSFCFLGIAQEKKSDDSSLQMEKWGASAGLIKPESVVFDAQNQCLYVSNGQKFAPGTDGFISKFTANGKLVQLKWTDSLSRPAGMALLDQQLWVADVDQLKVIDITNGKVVKSYPEPIKNSGLNDVAINPDGEVFVTASFVHAVFKVEGDSLKLWTQDEELLQWANGIYALDQNVLVGGTQLTSIDFTAKKIRKIQTNPPIVDIDGIWPDDRGGYVLSTVEGTALWHLNTQGESILLDQGGDYLGDLQFVPNKAMLFVPRGHHQTGRYYLAVYHLDLP